MNVCNIARDVQNLMLPSYLHGTKTDKQIKRAEWQRLDEAVFHLQNSIFPSSRHSWQYILQALFILRVSSWSGSQGRGLSHRPLSSLLKCINYCLDVLTSTRWSLQSSMNTNLCNFSEWEIMWHSSASYALSWETPFCSADICKRVAKLWFIGG